MSSRTVKYTQRSLSKRGLGLAVPSHFRFQTYECDEMVNLIVAQRAYEFNSKVITASDEMLQQANNLRN